MSCLEAQAGYFRLLMKGIFEPYLQKDDLTERNSFLVIPKYVPGSFRNVCKLI